MSLLFSKYFKIEQLIFSTTKSAASVHKTKKYSCNPLVLWWARLKTLFSRHKYWCQKKCQFCSIFLKVFCKIFNVSCKTKIDVHTEGFIFFVPCFVGFWKLSAHCEQKCCFGRLFLNAFENVLHESLSLKGCKHFWEYYWNLCSWHYFRALRTSKTSCFYIRKFLCQFQLRFFQKFWSKFVNTHPTTPQQTHHTVKKQTNIPHPPIVLHPSKNAFYRCLRCAGGVGWLLRIMLYLFRDQKHLRVVREWLYLTL